MRKFVKSWPLVFLLLLGFSGTIFGQNEEGKTYAVFLDNSGSLRPQLPRQKEIAKEIAKYGVENGVVSFFGFENDPDTKSLVVGLGLECTRDLAALNRQIDNISTIGGQTPLLDAFSLMSMRLSSKCFATGEKHLLLLTDGEDRVSKTKAEDLISNLKTNGIKVFAIGLVEELSDGSWPFGQSVTITDASTGKVVDKSVLKTNKSAKKGATEFLEKLTKETGGKVIFPKKKQTPAELVKLLFETSPVKPK